ncbi:hypothetical protein [Variovorax arabinosiphilus]|nr:MULTISPECIES: hypothetical protein [unclassified Variovorax]MDM0118427.1 hypothetical protein [Variovorax sp. J2L1-78]MDM0128852.1 hypothetical protein [Variovorax sp. J2L1-63]MDM0233362.1 hypothetical protein [Variovorax sp. J2R1-6]
MAKPIRTAEQLKALLLEHIERILELSGQATDVHTASVRWTNARPGEPT